MTVIGAAGPLGRVLSYNGVRLSEDPFSLADANALIILRRLAFSSETSDGGIEITDEHARALLRWATFRQLGQSAKLIQEVLARREAAVAPLRADGRAVRLRATPEWRLAVGLGDRANAHEIGLSLHGTYGWPVIPGSSLKGLTAHWAREAGQTDYLAEVFGSPRPRVSAPGSEAGDAGSAKGTVCFLDALPAGAPAKVELDVLTPHVKPYYENPTRRGEPVPPSDRHNPVPVYFLTVSGAFVVDLIGADDTSVEIAADWLIAAAGQLGAGGKTAAGYGYLTVTRENVS